MHVPVPHRLQVRPCERNCRACAWGGPERRGPADVHGADLVPAAVAARALQRAGRPGAVQRARQQLVTQRLPDAGRPVGGYDEWAPGAGA
jgi:hypothetical protein